MVYVFKILKMIKKLFLLILFILKWALAFIIIITIVQHFITPIYTFEEGKKFTGNVIHNPYHQSKFDWLKMNLHAHSKAWGGMTNGMNQNNDEVIEAYTQLKYDIIGISNYHDPQQIYFKGEPDSLTVYEYGYNLFKAHRLVVGYSKAKFREVSLFHTIHDRQFILSNSYPDSKVLIVAHPQFGKGHEMSDFSKLSNYHLIEVLNHYRYSEGEWDLALSHGKAVFIIGNDDMHDLKGTSEVGVRYTMVDAGENLSSSLDQLKLGNAYGVSVASQVCDIKLISYTLDSMQLQIAFSDTLDKIVCITDGGIVTDSVLHSSGIHFNFTPDISYMRIIAYKNDCKLYLNPSFRTTDGKLPSNEKVLAINWIATIGEKLILLLITAFLIWIIIRTPIKF